MSLSDKERKTLLQTRLRNLRRKYAKLTEHAELAEEAIETKCDIDSLEREIKAMK